MYTCCVSMKLKGNNAEFVRTLEKEVIPLLRKQKGFQDHVSLVSPERNEAIAISFWDKKESAEAYSREKYPAVRKSLSKTVEGVPRVETFEVANSTFHHGLTPGTFWLREHFVPNLGRNYNGYVPTSNRNYK